MITLVITDPEQLEETLIKTRRLNKRKYYQEKKEEYLQLEYNLK